MLGYLCGTHALCGGSSAGPAGGLHVHLALHLVQHLLHATQFSLLQLYNAD